MNHLAICANKMDPHSQQTLRRVEQNDATLLKLQIGGWIPEDRPTPAEYLFASRVSDDYSKLGASIGDNTHLSTLSVHISSSALSVEDRGFYDGLKQNSSIEALKLWGLDDNNTHSQFIGGVLHEVLKSYEENSSHLTSISINRWGSWCNCHNSEKMHQSQDNQYF